MDIKSSIEKTRLGFEESFAEGVLYGRQTADSAHLEMIINFLEINGGIKILDLGTGMGFLAFPIAKAYPHAEIIGLDIVEKALEENRKRAMTEGLDNLRFVSYSGTAFPFEDGSFDMVVTRYVLHHFPDINRAFREISRVLKKGGVLFLSDPAPNDNDTQRFVDAYMQLKKDAHIRFYTKSEWTDIGNMFGLRLEDGFATSIRFPRKMETAVGFGEIMERFDESIIKGYDIETVGDEIFITEKVNNLLFRKID